MFVSGLQLKSSKAPGKGQGSLLLHSRHVAPPVTLMHVPVPQSTHTVAPSAPEYLPSPQSTHADAPAAEFLPAPQSTQEVTLVAPVAPEYLPTGHLAQEQSPPTRPRPFMLQDSRRSLLKVPKRQGQVLQYQHSHSPLTHFEAQKSYLVEQQYPHPSIVLTVRIFGTWHGASDLRGRKQEEKESGKSLNSERPPTGSLVLRRSHALQCI